MQLEEGAPKLTLNLLSSCSMTWSVVILLEIRTLVGVPKDGVKIEVCRRQRERERDEWRKKRRLEGEASEEIYLVVVKVSIDRKAMLSFLLSLRG